MSRMLPGRESFSRHARAVSELAASMRARADSAPLLLLAFTLLAVEKEEIPGYWISEWFRLRGWRKDEHGAQGSRRSILAGAAKVSL